MSDLTLSEQPCKACGRPLVEQWLIYWAGPLVPRHANCAQFAAALEANPERFGVPAVVPVPS